MKVIVAFLALVLICALSIAIMIYGWGLTPENWWWIIGGYAAVVVLSSISGIVSALAYD